MPKANFTKPSKKVATKKSYHKPVSKSANRPATKSWAKQPSTTNVGTRPSVMPGQPGVPTGGTKIANAGAALAKPVNGKAAMLGPAPAVSRLAAIAQAAAKASAAKKTAANLQVKTPAPTARPAARPMTHPGESIGGGGTGFVSRTGSGGVVPSTTNVGTRPVTPTPAPTAPPVARPPVVGNTNPTPGFTSLTGRNVTAGRFNRQRLGRGPLANESLTPEELRRIAAQKVNNYG